MAGAPDMTDAAADAGTEPADERVQLDMAQLLPRLPADTLAQFEALSGLLIVNATSAQLMEAGQRLNGPNVQDAPLLSAINHETYHYFQAICTGYVFRYYCGMWLIVRKHVSGYSLRRVVSDLTWS